MNRFYSLNHLQRFAMCLLAFSLAGLNGIPFLASNGFVFIICILILLFDFVIAKTGVGCFSSEKKIIICLWGGWFVAALISTIVNLNFEVLVNFIFMYCWPFVLLLLALRLRPNNNDVQWIVFFLSLGLFLRFGYAATVYHEEFGVSLSGEIFYARDDVLRMDSYNKATFGNTGNTATIIGFSLSFLLPYFKLRGKKSIIECFFYAACFAILCLNMLIVSSRSVILITFLTSVFFVFLTSTVKFASIAILSLFVLVGYLILFQQSEISESAHLIFDYIQNDNSLYERIESIRVGIDLILDHPFGVGPHYSYQFNQYDAAHQIVVQQASEIGLIGGALLCLLFFIVIGLYFEEVIKLIKSEAGYRFAFLHGAFTWIIIGSLSSFPLGSSVEIPWVAFFCFFIGIGLAIQEKTPN